MRCTVGKDALTTPNNQFSWTGAVFRVIKVQRLTGGPGERMRAFGDEVRHDETDLR